MRQTNENIFNLMILLLLPLIMLIGVFVCLWEEMTNEKPYL